MVRSAPAAIGRGALVGHPHALGQLAGLPEHVDRDTAARIPVTADAQRLRRFALLDEAIEWASIAMF